MPHSCLSCALITNCYQIRSGSKNSADKTYLVCLLVCKLFVILHTPKYVEFLLPEVVLVVRSDKCKTIHQYKTRDKLKYEAIISRLSNSYTFSL